MILAVIPWNEAPLAVVVSVANDGERIAPCGGRGSAIASIPVRDRSPALCGQCSKGVIRGASLNWSSGCAGGPGPASPSRPARWIAMSEAIDGC